MKKLLLTIMIFLVGWYVANAQTKFIERLIVEKQKLAVSQDDTIKIKAMILIAGLYRPINLDSAFYYAETALELSKKIDYKYGQIMGAYALGTAYYEIGNFPKALELELNSFQIAEENQKVCVKHYPLLTLSRIYITLKDYEKAMHYVHEKIRLHKLCDWNSDRFGNIVIADAFEKTNKLDSALYFINMMPNKNQWSYGEHPLAYLVLGNIDVKSGNQTAAFRNYHKCYQIATEAGNHREAATVCLQMSKVFQLQNQRDSSIFYAIKSLQEATFFDHKQSIMEAAFLLSELYESTNTTDAFHYYKLATKTKESVFGAGNIQAIQSMIAQEEARQKDLENTRITYQNQMRQYGLLGALGVFLLLSTGLYRNVRKTAKAKKLLQAKNKTIQKNLADLQATQSQLIQSEKLASLGELTAGIAHEIQNPLNFVNNFSELSVGLANELKEEINKPEKDWELIEGLTNDLTQNQQKINIHGKRASSIVTGMLQHARTSSGKKEPTDINALADEYLRLSYHGLRAKAPTFNAKIVGDFDPEIGKLDVIPQDMGRVLLNLINNAFYAVSQRSLRDDKYEPTVSVSTKKLGDKVEIRVQDNGTGIPESVKAKIFQPFFTTKPTGQGTGLGLSLAYDIVVKGHGGDLKVETKEGEGTAFTIQLPVS